VVAAIIERRQVANEEKGTCKLGETGEAAVFASRGVSSGCVAMQDDGVPFRTREVLDRDKDGRLSKAKGRESVAGEF
jgi:hypothetical protein